MNNRKWVHAVSTEEQRRRNELVQQHIEQSMQKMEQWTEQECRRLKMTTRGREAAERAWRSAVVRRRKFLFLPKHTPPERRFLRMMIRLLLAEDPGLVDRAVELARYLSDNYAFEWTVSPVTALARAEARNQLLNEAESEFGDTPLARPFAFTLYHARQLHVKDIANPGHVYAMAVFLEQHQHFANKLPERRQELGLHKHALRREIRAREAKQKAAGHDQPAESTSSRQ